MEWRDIIPGSGSNDSKGSSEPLVTQEERQEAKREAQEQFGENHSGDVDKIETETVAFEDKLQEDVTEMEQVMQILQEAVEIDERRLMDDKQMIEDLEMAERELKDAKKHEDHVEKTMNESRTLADFLNHAEELDGDFKAVHNDIQDAKKALRDFAENAREIQESLDEEENNLEMKIDKLADAIGGHLDQMDELDGRMEDFLQTELKGQGPEGMATER